MAFRNVVLWGLSQASHTNPLRPKFSPVEKTPQHLLHTGRPQCLCSSVNRVTGNSTTYLWLSYQTSSASFSLGFPASLPLHLPVLPGYPKLQEPAWQPTAQLILQLLGTQSCTAWSPNYQPHRSHYVTAEEVPWSPTCPRKSWNKEYGNINEEDSVRKKM